MTSLDARLSRAADVLSAWRDVLQERPEGGAAPPAWCARRGWDGFLEALSDDDLERAELQGASALAALAGAPDGLVTLARDVVEVADPLHAGAPAPAGEATPPRKRAQVEALVARCRALDLAPRRVVDLGAGQGHLTRALAQALGAAQVLGLERDPTLVGRARAHAARERVRARFEIADVTAGALALAPGDLVVALHACGALGDAAVEAAARGGASLLLVACCPQKVPAPARAPVSAQGRALGLTLRRPLLGLANALASPIDAGGRAMRHAVRGLLQARGVTVAPGDEARGVPPRAWRDLELAASVALARRGLRPTTAPERAQTLERAQQEVSRLRRWSLPRRALAAALEVTLALDRARALEEAGARAEVGALFPRAVSPRNLGVIARAPR